MSFTTWLSLLAICALGAMSPGPSLATVIKHTLAGGRDRGIICAWAHSIGIGFYALVTLLGLAVLLQKSPMVFNAIAIIGALYLAWMGVQALRSNGGVSATLAPAEATDIASDCTTDGITDGVKSSSANLVQDQGVASMQPNNRAEVLAAMRDGLVISLFNPKIILFFLALFSQFVMVADSMWGQALIVFTPLIVDGLWYTFIALALSHPAVLPRLRAKSALIDKISGMVLIALAIKVMVTI